MRLLVFQHVATEHPGSFRDVMAARGVAWEAVELDEGGVIPGGGGFDGLLVLGGPMDVWEADVHPWLRAEMDFIRDWVAAQRPFLGICLGAQLLAASCGGEVGLMGVPEVGIRLLDVVPDRIFEGVLGRATGFAWHGAEVKRLPAAARLLAANEHCAIQAFAIGGFAYGLQFHLELTERSASDWGRLPAYVAALEQVRGADALPGVQAEVAAHFDQLYDTATAIFGNFLDIVAGERDRVAAAGLDLG